MGVLFKNPKTRLRNLIIIISFFVLLAVFFVIFSINSLSTTLDAATNDTIDVSEKYVIRSMDYHLRNNATAFQEELFSELKDCIENGSREEIAKSVAENFVADFYTWTNKSGLYDVGGMCYIYGPNKNNMCFQARDYFYHYLNYYIDEYGQSNLLEVESIDSSVEKRESYAYENSEYDAYFVICNWAYKDNAKFPTDGYYTREYFTVIDHNGRFEIVEAYGDE